MQLAEEVALLSSRSSVKRRSGAMRLRRRGDASAGAALLEALKKEVVDKRSWETQYQLIMALGECVFCDALAVLAELRGMDLEPMTLVAVGDALVRLGRDSEHDPAPLLEILSSGNDSLAEGALRAAAMLRMRLDECVAQQLVSYASAPGHEAARFWAAAAAAGWSGDRVRAFLEQCLADDRPETRRAAKASLHKEYLTWKPL